VSAPWPASWSGSGSSPRLPAGRPPAAARGRAGNRERTRRLGAPDTGIDRIRYLGLAYPVFNWDAIPIKQGLHNRHLVGLVAADTFLYVPGLSLYGRTVLVVGYGPVGRGVLPFEVLSACKSGAFLANLGHTRGELPI
jgi:hypothetical protein